MFEPTTVPVGVEGRRTTARKTSNDAVFGIKYRCFFKSTDFSI